GEVVEKTDQTIIQSQDFLYNSFFMNFLRIALSSAFILAVIYTTNRTLFAVYILSLGLGLYTNFMFGSRVSREEKAAWKNVNDVQARALDVIQNIKETKLFGNEPFEARRRREHAEEQLGPLQRSAMLWRRLTTLENLWQNLGFAIAMFFIVLPA